MDERSRAVVAPEADQRRARSGAVRVARRRALGADGLSAVRSRADYERSLPTDQQTVTIRCPRSREESPANGD